MLEIILKEIAEVLLEMIEEDRIRIVNILKEKIKKPHLIWGFLLFIKLITNELIFYI